MARRIALFAAWLGATALAVVVAAAAVGTVRTEVTDQPAAGEPFAATTILADTSTTTTTSLATATTATDSSSTTSIADGSEDDTTSTTIPSSTTTSTTSPDDDDDDDSSPTTTMPAQTTTAPSVTKTYNMAGGTVTISASEPEVRFVGASPAAGYTIEVEDRGPNQVKVEFDGAGGESKFVAKWESGKLLIDIDED